MARLLRGHAVTAALLAITGSTGIGLSVWGASVLPAELMAVRGSTLALVVGGVLLAGSVLTILMGFRRDEGPAPSIPAHVAFMSKQAQPELDPATRAKVAPAPARAAVRPKAPAEMLKIDQQIRDVSREINKAGVMLATGKLSREGYAAYVEELKKQRGDLEAARMDLETRRHSA